ncbi:YdeI/OmpD-associated family protein [Parapedobacter sp. DT-150]|uniref:YdeI/OmpD-associated family protein n=1 Tax=Parapedobacter sp. DT-150 TaxID=3396162 RepID=UPI003F1E2930
MITVMEAAITFNTVILLEGNNTGIIVPEAVIEQLGSGKRPPVVVALNGFTYRSTVAVMSGRYMIPLSAERRMQTGLKGGEQVDVTLTLDTLPREVEVPEDLQLALQQAPEAQRFFANLSYSVKLRYVLPITQAKAPETRARRVEKTIADLLMGKK